MMRVLVNKQQTDWIFVIVAVQSVVLFYRIFPFVFGWLYTRIPFLNYDEVYRKNQYS
jgi:hypothetical protein